MTPTILKLANALSCSAKPAGLGLACTALLAFPAMAHEATSLDITDAIFASRNADCATYENLYSSDVTDTQQNRKLKGTVHVTAYDDHCVLESNSIPNHDTGAGSARNFVAPVTEISGSFSIPRNPKQQASATALDQRSYDAILLNGVVVDILSAGCYRPDGYHGNPMAMFDDHPGSEGSPVIGFAADGFPIYGSYFTDATGTMRKARSGYSLKPGTRPSSASDPGGAYDGMYVDDYAFTDTGDLDACNGMVVNGQYAYYVTDSYPWVIKCFTGTPDPSFAKKRP